MLLGFLESSSEIFISSYSRIFSNGDRANFFSFRIIKRYVIHAGSKSFLFSSLIALIDVIDRGDFRGEEIVGSLQSTMINT